MAKESNQEVTHETHLGVDAWAQTSEVDESTDGLVPAARILAGEEPQDNTES